MESRIFSLQDGGTITATCASDFVTKLRESSRFDFDCTDAEYMVNFADRFMQMSGQTVRTDSPDHFLEDLLKYDYAKLS
ncbi:MULTISPECIES: hypothetical protein [Parabacteroides]|jgi:hypothetical protein|uniref:Uncharacterized protein n=1 Tax=Parabacteroides goldsteinii CL02T12C30 TaxID=999418 RepID=K5Z1P1_9BACT|nr:MULTISPECIES: hypothetical protein [Parabacteroides]EKN09444.1 hypothetical protein HMPREF1076_04473 [Parabacteroides goldsteinii CL02T12C30]DAV65192.1 MAG TPA: hypothetical protein [Caudoviricetes sp.]